MCESISISIKGFKRGATLTEAQLQQMEEDLMILLTSKYGIIVSETSTAVE